MTNVRVLHLRNCRGITDITGPENYLLSLIPRLNQQGCEASLSCVVDPRRGETPWLKEANRCGLPMMTIPVSNRLSARDVLTVVRLVRERGIDIIHTHDHRADAVGIMAARITGCAVVATFAGWTNWPSGTMRGTLYPWIDRQVLRYADVLISDSATMAAQIDQGTLGPPVVVIPNGVDTEVFHPDTPPSLVWEHAEGRRPFVLGMVGRIHPNKGQMEFLKAAVAITKTHPDCRFLIVGEAPPGYEAYKADVLRFIEEKRLGKVVTVTKASRAQIPGIIAGFDMLVAPSFTESFSFALIEAMAMRKPIVATNSGGTPELITHNETGVLIDPGNVELLALTMRNLMNDQAKMRSLGVTACEYVNRHLSVQSMSVRTLNIYREIVAWRKQRRTGVFQTNALAERLQRALVLDKG